MYLILNVATWFHSQIILYCLHRKLLNLSFLSAACVPFQFLEVSPKGFSSYTIDVCFDVRVSIKCSLC